MGKTYVQPGDFIAWTNATGTAVVSGQVVRLCGLICVATGAIANGASGTLQVTGVHALPKANEAINQGAMLYWDDDGNPYGGASGTGCLTATDTSNVYAGRAAAAAEATDTTVDILLNV
jgi:predicted RecA/RadA family phage recombinase